MRRSRSIRGAANFGCIVWLAIVGVVGYVLWKVVPVKVASSEFYDVMQEQAAFGSIKDVRSIELRDPAAGRRAQGAGHQGQPEDHQVARR
jgi:hypothetical protein